MKYAVDPNAAERQVVGKLDLARINRLLGTSFAGSGEVWMYPGLKKHVLRRHRGVFEEHYQQIPQIIESPDYVGHNPKEPDSVELIKRISDTVLLAIKLDPTQYFYVSTFYNMKNGKEKIRKRLKTGRLKPYR